MIKNYFLTAFRNINRSKFYFSINIIGLSLGIACCILISLYVLNELSYDKFNSKADRIYRVKYSLNLAGVLYREASIPFPAAEALKNEFHEIEEAVRIYKNIEFPLIEYNKNKFLEEEYYFADKNIFSVFDFHFLKGNPKTALSEQGNVVITKEIAEKYFGNSDPMGKLIIYNTTSSLRVTGVVENPPANSHFKFDFLSSLDYQLNLWESITGTEGREKKWYWTGAWTYVLLKEKYLLEKFESRLQAFVSKYFPDKIKGGIELAFQPLRDIYLYSDLDNEISPTGSIQNVYIFSAIAFFVLLVACINFINLSTAQSFTRIREIGVRKIIGAYKNHLMFQIFSETIIVTLVAILISLIVLEIFIPVFNETFSLQLKLNIFSEWNFAIVIISLIFLVGFLSGTYPAYFISRINPLDVLKRTIHVNPGKDNFRKLLVVIQFFISISLLISIGVINQQIRFLKQKTVGYDKENILFIKARPEMGRNFNAFKEDLFQSTLIKNVSSASNMPGEDVNAIRFIPQGFSYENPVMLPILSVDDKFVESLSISIKDGRGFSKTHPSDIQRGFILNEAAVKMLGWQNDAVGKKMEVFAPGTTEIMKSGEVIGVVKDFNFESLHHEIKPLVLINEDVNDYYIVKLSKGNLEDQITLINKTWSKFSPDWPIEYVFLDKNLEKKYLSEQKLERITNYFTIIAVVLACIGLFGLSGFTASQKTKDIGVRKVLGATSFSITLMLIKSFLLLIFISFIISVPVTYWFMNKWLQNFAYRIDISWGVFILSGGIAVFISLLTVSFQTIRAAMANPVENLKYE